MPPERFLAEIARIESGDTFAARLARFDESPDPEQLDYIVNGLISRTDFGAAYARVDAFQAATPELENDPSLPLLVKTMATQHGLLYRRAARQLRAEWEELPDLTGARATPALVTFVEAGPATMAREEQIAGLREARHADAGRLLDMMPAELIPDDLLLDAAGFAFDNGLYDLATGLYLRWYATAGESPDPNELNSVAWNLLLCQRELETALEIARKAYAGDSSPSVGDTLASLLYVTGATDEAIELESKVAAAAEGKSAEEYTEIVELMKAGKDLGLEPGFESYPEG
jgi:hypothetical protein